MMQTLINILVTYSNVVLMSVSFLLIYSLTHFFHFAHGAVYMLGAYYSFFFIEKLKLPLVAAVTLGIISVTICGCLMEVCVYRPLRKKNASSMILLLASLGIYIILQNVVSMLFGANPKSIRMSQVKVGLNVFGARITPAQILIICAGIILVILTAILLKKYRMGKASRAVANDMELANISGINSNNVILWSFAIGSALAGMAGILFSLDLNMNPTMGMRPLMMGVVAVIIGGLRSIPGVALGALLLSISKHLGVWVLGSQWEDAITFVILIIFLLIKPEGFMGQKAKRTST